MNDRYILEPIFTPHAQRQTIGKGGNCVPELIIHLYVAREQYGLGENSAVCDLINTAFTFIGFFLWCCIFVVVVVGVGSGVVDGAGGDDDGDIVVVFIVVVAGDGRFLLLLLSF